MRFDDRLWDGSDPTYAPCTGVSGGLIYWKAPAKYRKAGYAFTTKRLAGKAGDGLDLERAAQARDLTREMVNWLEGSKPKLNPGTWGELFARYKSDDISPLMDVQPNTKVTYLENIAYWEPVLAHDLIADFSFVEAKRIVRAMQEKGRSAHFIKAKFTMLRILAGYGVALKMSGAKDAQAVLGELRLKSPKPRTSSPSEAQVMAIIAAADRAGDVAFATGVLIQWRLALRAMDVRGDFFKLEKGEERSGICRKDSRWGNGLVWHMFDKDITVLSKAATKTIDSDPETIDWDLMLVPDVRDRLMAIPQEKRVGPVIVDRNGMPFDRFRWSDLWRAYRKTANVPDDIWMMDTRAGAINDANRKGATKVELQQAANHADGKTTERYIREKSVGANNVLRLRAERS